MFIFSDDGILTTTQSVPESNQNICFSVQFEGRIYSSDEHSKEW